MRELVSATKPVVVIDPGKKGFALFYRPVNFWDGDFKSPFNACVVQGVDCGQITGKAAMLLAQEGDSVVVVVEEGFGGGRFNVQSDLRLARSAGAAVAMVALVFEHVDVIWVPSTEWQSAVLGCTPKDKRDVRKAKAIAAARKVREGYLDVISKPNKDKTESFSECVCMAAWYRIQCGKKFAHIMGKREEERRGR